MRNIAVGIGALALTVVMSGSGMAASITLDSTALLTSGDRSVDFEGSGLADNTVITNQFAADGLTFEALGNDGAIRINSCGEGAWPVPPMVSGSHLNTYGPNCATNGTNDNFAINFDDQVSSLTMGVFYDVVGQDTLISAFLGATEVGSLSLGLGSGPGFLNFSGMIFDSIVFDEAENFSWVVLDNLVWTISEATGVPTPGALALLGFGLLGLGMRRRTA